MNKRALIRQLDRHMNDERKLLETWVTFDVPASIPRWSPGPEWVEADCASFWLRPDANGQHKVMVLTYDRGRMSPYEVLEEDPLALVVATVNDDPWYATFADKPHRIYNGSSVQESTLAIVGIDHNHPAAVYHEHKQMMRLHVAELLNKIQPPASYHTMWFGSEVQIKPDGSGWYITLNPSLGLYTGEFEKDYWADVHDLAYMVQRFARVLGSRKIYIERREQPHFVDTLWGKAMAAVGGP